MREPTQAAHVTSGGALRAVLLGVRDKPGGEIRKIDRANVNDAARGRDRPGAEDLLPAMNHQRIRSMMPGQSGRVGLKRHRPRGSAGSTSSRFGIIQVQVRNVPARRPRVGGDRHGGKIPGTAAAARSRY